MDRPQKKSPAAVSSAAEPLAMSQAATARLLHAVAHVPVHHAVPHTAFRAMHAADGVVANVDDAVLRADDGRGWDWAEGSCRGRRGESGGTERGQQSRSEYRSAQGRSPLGQPPKTMASVEVTRGAERSTTFL
jgi:hypothetical protein